MTPAAHPTLVVGIGASEGGLVAFRQLTDELPSDSGMAFVLVQHLDPLQPSLLAELLAPRTQMRVCEAEDGRLLERDTIYVIRPNTLLAVRSGRFQVSRPELRRGAPLPVDHLFRSLAEEYGPRSVGIVLSGAGSDGSAGIRSITASGGLVIAQDPDTGHQRGMPQSAIDTGVDLVLPISAIPLALRRFSALPAPAVVAGAGVGSEQGTHGRPVQLTELEIGRLGAVLDAQAGFDLRVYKPATIRRRVARRMSLSGFEAFEPYLDHLRMRPEEQRTLIRDLLISVTELFRDPEAFRTLREMVIDPMVSASAAGATSRVWVPGCATGEEAYSIAIEFLEASELHQKPPAVHVFATDVDQDALAFARAGVYPASIAEHISERRLRTYFQKIEGKGYQVRQTLRDVVSFAEHDLTKDPPFSRMNLVSCRNVLIYLTPSAQSHVLKALHFALQPDGCLFLSTSEGTGPQRELFTTLSKAQRIYRRVGPSRPLRVTRSRNKPLLGWSDPPRPATAQPGRRLSEGDLARRAVLEAIAPPTLVVLGDGTVIFSHGELGAFVRIPEGDNPRFELGSILRPEFATRVRGVLYKCRRSGEPQYALSSPDATPLRVRIGARPAPSLGDEAVILTFEDVPTETLVTFAERAESLEDEFVNQLEKELQATREDLRSTVEELEISNEQLRSSNEESSSMNEELQSANEELEATTEELRSLNEELTTVNAQLREKVEQVELAHDDLNNFFSSTKVATIFLDERLCIKRFTPAAREMLGIDTSDTGRVVSDIAREVLQHDLAAEAKSVLEHLSATTREVRTSDGRWITRQVLPYRTENRRIEGVVVTFNDVSELRRTNDELNRRSKRLELAWEAARGGIFEHKLPPDDSTYVSEQWAQVLGYRCDELPAYGELLAWLLEQAHPEDRAAFEETYADLTRGESDRYAIELRFRHKEGRWVWVRKIGKVLERDGSGHPTHLLRMMIDITDLKEVEASLRESESRFREMADGLPLMVWVHDEAGQQELVNRTFCDFFGVVREDMQGEHWQVLVHPDEAKAYIGEFYTAMAERRPFHAEARVKHADGSWRWLESWGQPRIAPDGRFKGFVGTSADITERRRLEETLRDSEERFRTLADNISQLVWTCDHLGQATWYNQRWYDFTGVTWEGMKGERWKEVHHPDHLPRVQAGLDRALESQSPWEDTFPLRAKEGGYRWFLSRAIPIRDESGAVVRWFGTNTDVTELREIEHRLVQADRQKDEFLAMLGHELRNPLAAIRTASELLKVHATGDPKIAKPQQVLERQSAHMAKLLDGLLDISRIIRGKIHLDLEVLDLSELCREVATDIGGGLANRRLDVRTNISPHSLYVKGDRVRLAQVLSNLLANAVKYTPDGGSIDVSLGNEGEMAVLVVQDSGVGIEPELLPDVFEIFRQSNQSIDRAEGGLGLGLALVKKLVNLHKGEVEAHSEGVAQGARFVVRLPLSQQQPARAHANGLGAVGAQRVLLIEDNDDAAQMLKDALEMAAHQVTIARTGEQGVSLARAKMPDAIICDLGLPGGMSGFDVARELRLDPRLARAALIALSGYGRPEDKAKSKQAGFDAHLTKPVNLEAVDRTLRRIALKKSHIAHASR